MKNRKWAKILLMGLALGIGSAAADIPQTACAAEGVDGFSDVPKDHWAYEALDYLAEDGIIEGYEDGTFRGGRTMTRYEMASIVAKAMMKGGGSLVDIAVLEKMQREFDQELQTLKQQVAQNTKDIAELKKERDRVKLYGYIRAQWQNDNRNDGEPYADQNTNRRFMLDLRGDFKINPEWVGHFDVEAKQHYTHQSFDGGRISHEDGTFKRLWLTGNFKNGLEITAGRRWTPLGMNFTLLGADTVGIDATYPITKSGLRAGAFCYTMDEYSNADFNFYGPIIQGPVGHNFDIVVAFAKLNKDKQSVLETPYVPGDTSHGNWIGSQAFLLGFGTNVAKNLRLSVDYVRTNHSYNDTPHSGDVANIPGDTGNNNQSFTAKLDYKWTNPDVVGSFGAYVRYHYIGRNGTIWNDDNDGLMLRNSRGWTLGFRYVPWKHVVWGVDFTISDAVMAPWLDQTSAGWADQPYRRRTIRSQLDFHF